MSQVLTASQSTVSVGRDPLIQVRDLSVTFLKEYGFLGRQTRTTKAVDNVSFDLFESETLILVGESGSGKTTVARCVLGLNPPTSGSIKYMGIEVTKLRGASLRTYRRDVQIAFQDPFGSLNPYQDVLATLSTPIKRLLGENNPATIEDMAIRLLEDVGLEPQELLHKLPHQLSGGERQRVNIARALASKPRILVADEPVSMLDASQRLNLLLLLKELQKEHHIAILMITHDLATARVMGGRTAVMYVGKLFEISPTESLLTSPYHPYTELLISVAPKRNFASSSAVEVPASTIEKSEALHVGCVFRNRCKYATGICAEVEPPLEGKGESSRLVACHNWINRSTR
jgi:peptide/nickel transport system ATP-binding protein